MSCSLENYNFPDDLKTMDSDQLELLSYLIRDFLVEKVSKTGGHLASNLGVVELTIGMHKVFDSPKDKFIWDVGHQSYVHKILTGRASGFDKLRQFNGMSGFPKTNESPHDIFETGHSTTSLSAAFGIAKARDLKKEDFDVVAVIGDGSLTGGMAYEALNNIGASKTKMIIILNDNGMSISKNTGSISKHLVNLRTSKGYLGTKSFINRQFTKNEVGKTIRSGLKSIKDNIKYSIIEHGGVIFEELGFTYFGPIDGHDINQVIDALTRARKLNEPVVIHAITQKGKGYSFAENEPRKFHGVGPFNPVTGETAPKSSMPTYSSVMGKKLVEIANRNTSIVAITAAMGDATGLAPFKRAFPDRFFDVGIAEQHAVTFSAGLAAHGMKPLVAIYSTFLQRSYDQLMMDVCLQNLPVVFAIDRAGNVGQDGETHHGLFDLAYLNTMPNMTILAPHNGKQLEEMLEYAFSLNGPVAIRYPRGNCHDMCSNSIKFNGNNIRYGSGNDIEIWAVGNMFSVGESVCELLSKKGYSVGLVDVGIISPMDLKEYNNNAHLYVTIEDGEIDGGFGQLFNSMIANTDIKVINFAWPKKFIEQGSVDQLMMKYHLDPLSISERIEETIERKA